MLAMLHSIIQFYAPSQLTRIRLDESWQITNCYMADISSSIDEPNKCLMSQSNYVLT